MLDRTAVRGVVVPVATPLTEEEHVDEAALRKLVSHMIEGGVHGLFVLGTTGEFARLEEEQKLRAAQVASEAIDKRVPIYFGVSDCGTKKVRRNIRIAEQLGADIIVCTLPYYIPVRSPREQLYFFESILDSTELPVMLYNIPSTIAVEIDLDVVEKLCGKTNLIGIKDSGGNADYLRELVRIGADSGAKVLVGDESLSAAGLHMGADGLVPSLGNVFPRLLVDLYESAARGDLENTNRLQSVLAEINRFNACSESWLGALIFRKRALRLMGMGSDLLAEPYVKPDAETMQRMEAAIGKWIEAESGNAW